MQAFLDIALGFPTVIWSALIGVVLVYWLFVILGALDLELLDLDIDFDAEGDFDVDVDGAAVDGSASPLAQLAGALGIGKVPVTILVTFFTFAGWVLSYFGTLYATPVIRFGAVGALLFAASFALAIPAMAAMAHPLKKVFETKTRRGGADLIGQVCEVTTGSVSERFGQARYDDGGAGLLLKIRCDSENDLGRRAAALIIGYDREGDVYLVEPYGQFQSANPQQEV